MCVLLENLSPLVVVGMFSLALDETSEPVLVEGPLPVVVGVSMLIVLEAPVLMVVVSPALGRVEEPSLTFVEIISLVVGLSSSPVFVSTPSLVVTTASSLVVRVASTPLVVETSSLVMLDEATLVPAIGDPMPELVASRLVGAASLLVAKPATLVVAGSSSGILLVSLADMVVFRVSELSGGSTGVAVKDVASDPAAVPSEVARFVVVEVV